MTELEIRRLYVDKAVSFFGTVQGDERHAAIVQAYNLYLPHPRGYELTTRDPWCAAFVSACAVLTDLAGIVPVECSCGEQIKLFRQLGRWEERDEYVPQPGDLLFYDWQDSGKGDCTGAPDHVGIIVTGSSAALRVLEGNKGDAHVVGYRDVPTNGRYIRGFGLPDFASMASCTPSVPSEIPQGYCAAALPVLARGATGEAVRAMQTLLNLRFGWGLTVDGSFGPATERTLKSFQAYCKIDADGSCGPITWGRLVNG